MELIAHTIFKDGKTPVIEQYDYSFLTILTSADHGVLLECLAVCPYLIVKRDGFDTLLTASWRNFIDLINSLCTDKSSASVRRFGNELYSVFPNALNTIPGYRRILPDKTFALIR